MTQPARDFGPLVQFGVNDGIKRALEMDLHPVDQAGLEPKDIKLIQQETIRLVLKALDHAPQTPDPHVRALAEFVAMAFASGRTREQVRQAVASLCGTWDKPWD
ncbi:hypothetical protein [Catelliglobosispora koreensis]|uniref:hypothetical protein n=1 Tax=Catelliglobosispora koreensis TaxID=129052 RepID=UPI000475DFDC|nr:hypothetical protein [Catelliglobosispora koreensis]